MTENQKALSSKVCEIDILTNEIKPAAKKKINQFFFVNGWVIASMLPW